MGSARDLGTRAAAFTPYGAGRRRVRGAAGRACSPSTTTRSWPRTSTTRRRLVPTAPRRARGADRAGAGASGLLRLGDHRRGRRRADGRHRRAAAGGRRRRRRPRLGHGLQGRARPGRREDRLRPDVLRHGPDARPAALRPRRRGGRSPRSASSTAARPCSARRSPPGEIGKLWGLGDIRIGDAIGDAHADGTRRTTSRRRRWRRSSSRAIADDAGALRVALAQLAEQDPLINVRQDDVAAGDLGLALRRGAEGGHPGDAGERLRPRRHVPRDDDDLHRAAGRHRRGRRDPARGDEPVLSPRSGCASSPRRSARASSSGSMSTLATVPLFIYKTADSFARP